MTNKTSYVFLTVSKTLFSGEGRLSTCLVQNCLIHVTSVGK